MDRYALWAMHFRFNCCTDFPIHGGRTEGKKLEVPDHHRQRSCSKQAMDDSYKLTAQAKTIATSLKFHFFFVKTIIDRPNLYSEMRNHVSPTNCDPASPKRSAPPVKIPAKQCSAPNTPLATPQNRLAGYVFPFYICIHHRNQKRKNDLCWHGRWILCIPGWFEYCKAQIQIYWL